MRFRDLATLVTVLLVLMAAILFARWDIRDDQRRMRLLVMTSLDTIDLIGRHCHIQGSGAGITTQDGKQVYLTIADGTAVCVKAAQ